LKAGPFIIFFSIVLTLYGLVNAYIFIRGMQAIPEGSSWRNWYAVTFWLVAASFVAARVLERVYPSALTGVITWIGSFWLAFMLYFFLIVLLADLVRLIHHFIPFLPQSLFADYVKTKVILLLSSIALVTVVVAAGFINARIPKVRHLDLKIDKTIAGEKELNIVMASDIHLGTIIARRKANRLVETINALQPDVILFPGDIVDEDLAPVIMNNLGENLRQLKARFGVFAVTGNHEFIGGAEPAVKYLREHGITVLRDSAALVDGRFWLVGREDRDKPRFSGKNRMDLTDLVKSVDTTLPVILMDHQPFNLKEAAGLGVDLQLSGHTHHGQMWPFNHVTSAIYEVSTGHRMIDGTHFYVSSGFGTWGPPVRLGNRPEIVHIRLLFN